MSVTTAERFRRLLAFLPRIADGREHQIDDVSRQVGAEPADIAADLLALTNRAQDVPGWVDPLSIYMEGDSVEMTAASHFRRPMRLSADECAALELGLSMLRVERAPDDRVAVDETIERVRQVKVQSLHDEKTGEDREVGAVAGRVPERAASLGASRDMRHVPVIREAIRTHHRVTLEYQKPDAPTPESRVVSPLAFVTEQGIWYLITAADGSDGIRVFRMDRVSGAELSDETFQPPTIDLDGVFKDHRAFAGDPPEVLKVRYSPRVAKWIAERERGAKEKDGSYVVEYPLSSDEWAVRHVLRYGPEAEVIEPQRVRTAIGVRLQAMLA